MRTDGSPCRWLMSGPTLDDSLAREIERVLSEVFSFRPDDGSEGLDLEIARASSRLPKGWMREAFAGIINEPELVMRAGPVRIGDGALSGDDPGNLGPFLETLFIAMKGEGIAGSFTLTGPSELAGSTGRIATVGPSGWNWAEFLDLARCPEWSLEKLGKVLREKEPESAPAMR